ncbi:ferrous iron transport protein B [Holdemania massiliensis]|uniref:ferrous iron transport protein B n=1 Tax=Holdemania massiliensis TaxID=1468449 RepID=UPI001F060EF5|nr:ferrous iron transport protein B [Holdemania massiliensis]MCH1940939.1 ferrous iron transport protein B [Holdemania massiliensis]
MKTAAFVGNPNAGKTAWINALSDAGFEVGNWPGVTVERKQAQVQWGSETLTLIDLPGIYDLQKTNNEEQITQDFLESQPVDCLINVLDATHLQRALRLTLKLRMLQIPMILIFNFYDEVLKNGIEIDALKLSRRLACPILCVSAFDKQAVGQVKETILAMLKEPFSGYRPLLTQPLEEAWVRQVNALQLAQPFASSLALQKQAYMQLCEAQPQAMHQALYQAIDSLMSHVRQDPQRRLLKTRRIDAVLLHRIWGLPLLLAMSFAMLMLIYNGSSPYVGWLNQLTLWMQHGCQLLLGGVPAWLRSLVCDGLLAGIGSVLSFLPLMAFLYFFLGLLEESGYMARIAFLMDRLMRPFGCSGKAFVSLLLGLGCNVPAVMATRVIEEESSRRRTALVVPLISCGARLPIYLLFAAAFFPGQGGVIVFTLYGLSLVSALVLSLILSLPEQRRQPWMVLELPVYRRPSLKVVFNKVRQEVKNYTRKAMTVVMLAMTVLWGLTYFPSGEITTSYAAQFGKAASVIYQPLGFGTQWPLVASLPGSIAAKETVVGFLASVLRDKAEAPLDFAQESKNLVLGLGEAVKNSVVHLADFSQEGQDAGFISEIGKLFDDPLGKLRAYSFLVYCLFSIPCIMTLNALRQEYGTKLMLKSIAIMVLLPYGMSLILFQLGRLLYWLSMIR